MPWVRFAMTCGACAPQQCATDQQCWIAPLLPEQLSGPSKSPPALSFVSVVESVTLLTSQIPSHNHMVQVATSGGDQNTPALNSVVSTEAESVSNRAPVYLAYSNANTQIGLATQTVGLLIGSQPHSNIQPIL